MWNKIRLSLALLVVLIATPAIAQQKVGQPATVNDCSGTVTTGGTAVTPLQSNTARRYLYIQNPIAATEPLQVNINTAASNTAASYELAAGASLLFNGSGWIPTQLVSINAVTTAHRFVCKEGV